MTGRGPNKRLMQLLAAKEERAAKLDIIDLTGADEEFPTQSAWNIPTKSEDQEITTETTYCIPGVFPSQYATVNEDTSLQFISDAMQLGLGIRYVLE